MNGHPMSHDERLPWRRSPLSQGVAGGCSGVRQGRRAALRTTSQVQRGPRVARGHVPGHRPRAAARRPRGRGVGGGRPGDGPARRGCAARAPGGRAARRVGGVGRRARLTRPGVPSYADGRQPADRGAGAAQHQPVPRRLPSTTPRASCWWRSLPAPGGRRCSSKRSTATSAPCSEACGCATSTKPPRRRSKATREHVERTRVGAQVRTLDEFFNRLIVIDRRMAVIPGDAPEVALAIHEPDIVSLPRLRRPPLVGAGAGLRGPRRGLGERHRRRGQELTPCGCSPRGTATRPAPSGSASARAPTPPTSLAPARGAAHLPMGRHRRSRRGEHDLRRPPVHRSGHAGAIVVAVVVTLIPLLRRRDVPTSTTPRRAIRQKVVGPILAPLTMC